MNFRLIIAIFLGKAILKTIKILKISGGSAAPGLYALKICPNLVTHLTKQIPKNIFITGTNGKTTTARMLSYLVKSQNLQTIRNQTGSNLERGIASALLTQTNLRGKIKKIDLGIWEVDEAVFNKVVFKIKPEIMVFLNAFRDQLDRYGEVDTVIKNWQQSLAKVDWNPQVLINGNASNLLPLTEVKNLNPQVFMIKNYTSYNENSLHSAPDLKQSSPPILQAQITQNRGLKGISISIASLRDNIKVSLPVGGAYHVTDFLAALSVYFNLDLPLHNINQAMKNFSPAFGRVEELKIKNTQTFIMLIKNPAGANAVFDILNKELQPKDVLLFVLNDNFADGTDVSWIWDASFEKLFSKFKPKLICSGLRVYDAALRLKYAAPKNFRLVAESDLNKALNKSLRNNKGRLFILPTYTALLSLQNMLAKKEVKPHYWKEN